MATISTKTRNALPTEEFADPDERKYPIENKAHADNAAARLEQQKGSMSSAKYSAIKARITAAQKRFGEKKKPSRGVRVRGHLGAGGYLSVRHTMADAVQLEGQPVLLAEAAGGKDERVWIQLAKRGYFRGHAAGAFELSTRTFEEIIANFKATTNQAIPIDFEHASEQEPTQGSIPTDGAPAQGWIHDMKLVNGDLFGLVEWLAKARDYIKSGQYKFLSPAVRFNAKDRVTGKNVGARMTSAAMTNNPFLDGMVPLAATDLAHGITLEQVVQIVDDLVDAALGEDDEEDDEDEPTLNNDSVGDTPSAATETNMADAKEVALELSETKNKLADTSLRLKDETARADKAEGALKLLTDEKIDRDMATAKARVEEAFDTYKDDRNLDDSDKISLALLLKHEPSKFEERYPKIKPSERHLMRNLTDGRGPAQGSTPQKQGHEAVVDIREETFTQTTKRLMKDRNLSYTDAQNEAAQLRG